jgi:hypothetical protein
MGLWAKLRSAAEGALWTLRAGGLRESVVRLLAEARATAAEAERLAAERDALRAALAEAAVRRREAEEIIHGLRVTLAGREAADARRPEEERRARAEAWLLAGDLRAFERRVRSQNGEDGILEEIFRRLGRSDRPGFFVEFGAETGAEGNTAHLAIDRGWSGLLIEADEAKFARLAELHRDRPGVRTVRSTVRSDNIEGLLDAAGVPDDFDLLSVDIDGNDYWVWSAVRRRPAVVVVEFNAHRPPHARWVMAENNDHSWDGTDYFGASLASLSRLGRRKGYALVGCDSLGINAFFVRRDLVDANPDAWPDPAVFLYHSPPAFGADGRGHPPAAPGRPFVEE